MHSAAYAALGLDHTYEGLRVPLESVEEELERLYDEGFTGVNITVPLKEAAYRWSTPDPFAARAQAVNTIRMADRVGVNTDGPGMAEVINGLDGGSKRVLLLGAGGSSRAIALALTDAGHHVAIWNRTHPRALDLAVQCGCEADTHPDITSFGIVINATSASMSEELPSIISEQSPFFGDGASAAIDLYYSPEPTVFLRHFAAMNWRTMDGRELLVAQGALAFEFWLGIPAPREAMRAAVRL